jgi:hypothetical protein
MAATETVTELIASVRAAGGTIRRDGDAIEIAAPAPFADDLVDRIRAAKPALLAALDDPVDWQKRHGEALAYWAVLHPADEAAGLAWGEMQNRWQRLHGKRFLGAQCAGCSEAIGSGPALDVADGSRVHLDTLDCLIRYGQRWRGDASQALIAMGLPPPALPPVHQP